MRLNARALPASCLLVGFCLIALGFAWAASGGSNLTVQAPATAARGDTIPLSATSEAPDVRLVVVDATGKVMYDSDDEPGTQEEETAPDGAVLYSLNATFTVPADAVGPLSVTATDRDGAQTTKTISLTG